METRIILALAVIAIILGGTAVGLTFYLSGPAGPQGEQGPQGEEGAQGEQGPQGSQGAPGESAFISGAGLNVVILNAMVPADRKPVVTFNLTDADGVPVKVSDLEGISFTVAVIEVDSQTGLTRYKNYVNRTATGKNYTVGSTTVPPNLTSTDQAATDSGGSHSEIADGTYTYTFGTVLPEDYNVSATHVIAVYAYKDSRQYVSNDVYTFVPDGSAVTVTRLISTTETCNRCHDPLALHGGVRQEFVLCATCHTDQSIDPETGQTVDFKVLIHKIHKGADLSEPYYIVGYHESVHNYTEVEFPQDVRNCETCHTGPDGDNWKTAPSRAACGSCHDDVDFATGANHPGGAQTSDASCSACHASTMTIEFDASIPGAHVIDLYSSQLTGVNFEILSVANTTPGDTPIVNFTIKEDDGDIIPLADMNRIVILLAGPTTDYENYWRETATSSAVDNGDGTYSYAMSASIPSDATGSYAIGIEGRKETVIDDGQGGTMTVRDYAFNDVFYFPVTDSTAVPRRTIVSQENCDSCHENLSIHGNNRKSVEYCPICHMPSETDEAVRTSGEPVTIHFKYLIHRIHLGEEQSTPYIVYGYGSSVHNFSEVLFPGDLKNCEKCHVDDSHLLPLPSGVLPTNITYANGTLIDTIQPIAAACIACHDQDYVRNHADAMTASGESCETCHGEGKDFAVSKVHSEEHSTVSSIISPLSGSLATLMILIGGIVTSVTSKRKP